MGESAAPRCSRNAALWPRLQSGTPAFTVCAPPCKLASTRRAKVSSAATPLPKVSEPPRTSTRGPGSLSSGRSLSPSALVWTSA